jgi:translation elongation factor EF-Tu-like GTPase
MSKERKKPGDVQAAAVGHYTIGRTAFAKISAVEGIALTEEARQRTTDFERRRLSPEERRREIIKAHRRKA